MNEPRINPSTGHYVYKTGKRENNIAVVLKRKRDAARAAADPAALDEWNRIFSPERSDR